MSTKYKFRNPEGIYFVSFAVFDWVDVFSRKIYNDLFLESLVFCQKNKGLVIHAWIIMSNHIHLIISSIGDNNLENIMRDLKKFTAYKILKEIKESQTESRKNWMLYLFKKAGSENSNNTHYQFWQQDNHPIELDPFGDLIEQRLNYLHDNPVKAGIVQYPAHYNYSSAIDYEDGKGLIDIEKLV